ncbi:hypothetical protein QKU48_gp0924 [Fadolivirus algeromassiliense]|jgi:hypothetical protein|uniref:Uncharacterized protein n=1 Tax=Fadolivirus FV1/VV64 TaxID=3070911 RepID=A0A7D3R1B7_9VIRU|nr:hypothetical protein QKU48_gp0924 [Fadolivirus algeromassiliense]QKF94382.1 hypothetical protein Fadolivirus_1_924 [Fadolivirus FV1/VV64]
MEAFPDNFSVKTIEKELQLKNSKIQLEQDKLKAEFRMKLYQEYTELLSSKIIPDYLSVKFPDTLLKDSRVSLLNELMERFPKNLYYNPNAYINPQMRLVTNPILESNHSEYRICFRM